MTLSESVSEFSEFSESVSEFSESVSEFSESVSELSESHVIFCVFVSVPMRSCLCVSMRCYSRNVGRRRLCCTKN